MFEMKRQQVDETPITNTKSIARSKKRHGMISKWERRSSAKNGTLGMGRDESNVDGSI